MCFGKQLQVSCRFQLISVLMRLGFVSVVFFEMVLAKCAMFVGLLHVAQLREMGGGLVMNQGGVKSAVVLGGAMKEPVGFVVVVMPILYVPPCRFKHAFVVIRRRFKRARRAFVMSVVVWGRRRSVRCVVVVGALTGK